MSLRDLPSVEALLQTETATGLVAAFGRPLTVQALRHRLEAARRAIRAGSSAPEHGDLLEQTRATLEAWLLPSLQPVINATGVIVHTNLGRAPLSSAAQEAMHAAASGYTTLEYDLERGGRGARGADAEELLTRLTGAAGALIVNNNAAAVLLALTALARGREVILSRSQLVEIGGGFRIPEVLEQSGASLVEVGTTNRTHLRDLESAIHERSALILRVHSSNFKIVGFTAQPTLDEMVRLAREHDLPVLDDLGSGALMDTSAFGLGHEPMVQESLQAGASLVAFSGDKLLGGPQAGVLVGEAGLIERLRVHPLARAVRPDKLCLAAMAATLIHYVKDEAAQRVPVWQMIAAGEGDLEARARRWAEALGRGKVRGGRSTIGGGSLPEETLPTRLLALRHPYPDRLTARLRAAPTPVIARIEDDDVILDPRTVLPGQEEPLLRALEGEDFE